MNTTLKIVTKNKYLLKLVCPATYSCHVAPRLFYSQFKSERSGYRDSRCGYFRIGYSSITRRTWHFRIYFEDIREYLVSGNSLLAVLAQAMGHNFARVSLCCAPFGQQLLERETTTILLLTCLKCVRGLASRSTLGHHLNCHSLFALIHELLGSSS